MTISKIKDMDTQRDPPGPPEILPFVTSLDVHRETKGPDFVPVVTKLTDVIECQKEYIAYSFLRRKFYDWVPEVYSHPNWELSPDGRTFGKYEFYEHLRLSSNPVKVSRLYELLEFIPVFHKWAKEENPFRSYLDPGDSERLSEWYNTEYGKWKPLFRWISEFDYGEGANLEKRLVRKESAASRGIENAQYEYLTENYKRLIRQYDNVAQFIKNTFTYSSGKGISVIHRDLRVDNLLLRNADDHIMVIDWGSISLGLMYTDITRLTQSHNIEALHAKKFDFNDPSEELAFFGEYLNRYHNYEIPLEIALEAEPLYWAQAFVDNMRLATAYLSEKGIKYIGNTDHYLRMAERASYYFNISKYSPESGKMGILGNFITPGNSIGVDTNNAGREVSDLQNAVVEMV